MSFARLGATGCVALVLTFEVQPAELFDDSLHELVINAKRQFDRQYTFVRKCAHFTQYTTKQRIRYGVEKVAMPAFFLIRS